MVILASGYMTSALAALVPTIDRAVIFPMVVFRQDLHCITRIVRHGVDRNGTMFRTDVVIVCGTLSDDRRIADIPSIVTGRTFEIDARCFRPADGSTYLETRPACRADGSNICESPLHPNHRSLATSILVAQLSRSSRTVGHNYLPSRCGTAGVFRYGNVGQEFSP